MKKVIVLTVVVLAICIAGCPGERSKSEQSDREFVDKQQQHYQKAQPIEFFDWSIPRDVYQQIYRAVTTQKVTTFTIIESITGELKYAGPSIGYPIPADMSLTNPLQPYENRWDKGGLTTIEQAEPMGLFSSKNTDGTWVLFVDEEEGILYPVYSEHKCTAFPFMMQRTEKGEWKRADRKPPQFTIQIRNEPQQ